MARAAIEDPLKVFRFRIVVDGMTRAGFSEFGPLDRNTEKVKYREGGMNETPQLSAGLTEFPDVTMKRGQIVGSSRGGDDDFLTWAQDVMDVSGQGNASNYRRDLDVEQYNAMNQRVSVKRLYNAWPVGYKPNSDLNALGNDNSFEELKLCYEGWEVTLG